MRVMLATGFLVAMICHFASAAPLNVVFAIDPQQSSLTFTDNGSPSTEQVDGHFLVNFDPLTSTAGNIQFIPDDGFFSTTDNELSWDFSSSSLRPTVSQGTSRYSATSTRFTITSTPFNGYTDLLSSGTWKLTQSTPGVWTLALDATYNLPSQLVPPGSTESYHLLGAATASFGAQNVTTVAPTDTTTAVLGGTTTIGGVAADFSAPTGGGTFSAQEVPTTGLSLAAYNALGAATNFQLAGGSTPQIWDLQFSGALPGPTTLTFNYDPSLLGGLNPSDLFIEHFNSTTGQWENLGGTVDAVDHTITVVTDSFSPFALGTVPEPGSFALAATATGVTAVVYLLRRRSRARR